MAAETVLPTPSLSPRASFGLLAALIVLCLAVGWSGSLVTQEQIPTWYAALEKPAWTPPPAVFGPVWTVLYILMGVAGWRVAKRDSPGHPAWGLWWIQLLLNAAWTPLFFGAHAITAAALLIGALWVAVAWFIGRTWRLDRVAAWCFVPYLLWITYAASLNIGVVTLNEANGY